MKPCPNPTQQRLALLYLPMWSCKNINTDNSHSLLDCGIRRNVSSALFVSAAAQCTQHWQQEGLLLGMPLVDQSQCQCKF